MSTTMKSTVSPGIDARVLARILAEGYGPGAWHGADMKAAVADVTAALAYWRPAAGRHNIAEIALHHAYYVRDVRAKLTGREPEPFVVEGQDWFPVSGESPLGWDAIRDVLDREQRLLADAVEKPASGSAAAETPAGMERLEAVLGITCHAVYHAGQVQLLKALAAETR